MTTSGNAVATLGMVTLRRELEIEQRTMCRDRECGIAGIAKARGAGVAGILKNTVDRRPALIRQ